MKFSIRLEKPQIYRSPSVRRAWIEIRKIAHVELFDAVALREEGVD